MSRAGAFDHVVEMFAAFGPVSVRRMFGGAGIFADSMMIGIVDRGVIYLKADDATRPDFEREGLGPFTYANKDGERSLASYWRMPEQLYDEPEELARWASKAHDCARRASALKRAIKPVGKLGKKARQGRDGGGPRAAEARDAVAQATLVSVPAATSGSVWQITRLRPFRLAA